MKKVVVGMSGGVDSSVAAILLQEKGYEVIGVTFVFTEQFDSKDAIEVCKKLGIKHYILDYKRQFKENVINKFINDYKSGITPNPCILCNREIKFNFLYNAMKELNCDFFATGHYARIIDGKLYRSSDLKKDQTYFLCEVKKELLNYVLFPLEEISKDKVRQIALKYNLANANKKDSTDICFITNKFNDYISEKADNISGDIVDVDSLKIIGKHNGLSKYTIGQRKGLGVGGSKERMFVVGKDKNKNILYVALGNNNNYLISDSCIVTNINWLGDVKVNECKAKFRYKQEENDVTINWINELEVLVKYPQGIKAVTKGQACAFYKENQCLGGGIINDVMKQGKELL